LAWRIEYADTARNQFRKLDKAVARRILDFMDDRVAPLEDPRAVGKALVGPLGGLWCYRVGNYRVICEIQDDRVRVLVVRVGERSRVYR